MEVFFLRTSCQREAIEPQKIPWIKHKQSREVELESCIRPKAVETGEYREVRVLRRKTST